MSPAPNATNTVSPAVPPITPEDDNCTISDNLQAFCPRCSGQTIDVGQFGHYFVSCDTIYTNVTFYDDIHNATVGECIDACTELGDCYAPVISPEGKCLLATGNNDPSIAKADGFAALMPRFTGALPEPTPSFTEVLASSTAIANTSTSSVKAKPTTSNRCPIDNIACPHCNGAHIVDELGKTYRVYCNNQLFSESTYSPQEWLSPEGCLAMCDNFNGCEGTTFWPQGNCELARGPDTFPEHKEGFIAFLPVNLSYTPPPDQLSAYPTEPITSPTHATRTPPRSTISRTASRTRPSKTRRSSTSTASSECNPSNITCPECNFYKLTDGFKEPYTVRCNVEPSCGDIAVRYGNTQRDACLIYCDTDPTCLAAIYEDGQCSLCEGSLQGVNTYSLQDEYVVFIADSALNSSNSSTTASTSIPQPSHTPLPSTIQNTPSPSVVMSTVSITVSPSPLPTPAIDLVTCPAYDDYAVEDPTDGREYVILCDNGLVGDSTQSVSASNFAECAAFCTGGCGGMQFGSSTECQLLTSISIVSPLAGQTAGVLIMFPGTNAATPTTALPSVTGSLISETISAS